MSSVSKPPSGDILGVVRLTAVFLVSAFFVVLAALALPSGHWLAIAFFAVTLVNFGATLRHEFSASGRQNRILALLFALSSTVPIAIGFPVVRRGPEGGGSAAAGIGFLIGLAVLASGILGAVFVLWYAWPSSDKAAQTKT